MAMSYMLKGLLCTNGPFKNEQFRKDTEVQWIKATCLESTRIGFEILASCPLLLGKSLNTLFPRLLIR